MSIAGIVIAISGLTALTMSVVLFLMARSFPNVAKGVYEWALAAFLMSISIPLFLIGNNHSEFLSIVVSLTLLLCANIFVNSGVRKFSVVVKPYPYPDFFLFVISFVILICMFTYIYPDTRFRIVIYCVYSLIVLVDTVLVALKNLDPSLGKNLFLTALAIFAAARILRAFHAIYLADPSVGPLSASFFHLGLIVSAALAIPLVTIAGFMLVAERLIKDLEFANKHDGLTNCLNKTAVTQQLRREIVHAHRHKITLSIIMMDLDEFKVINDTQGHIKGDRVLVNFVRDANKCLRQTDFLGRFGGDEFIAILPITSEEEAMQVAQRLHKAAHGTKPISCTLSVGIAQLADASETIDSLLSRADAALYKAKSQGRNQSCRAAIPMMGVSWDTGHT